MKRGPLSFACAFLVGLLFSGFLSANATISGRIENIPQDSLSFSFPMYYGPGVIKSAQLEMDEPVYTLALDLKDPVFIHLICGDFQFNLLIKPGDNIQLDFDAKDMRNTFSVKGSAANAYYLQSKCNPLWSWTATDKGPDPLSTFLQFVERIRQEKESMKRYGIDEELLPLLEFEVDYFYVDQMMLLTRDYHSYDRPIYITEIDELLSQEFVNNSPALACPSYGKFLFSLADYFWKYKSKGYKKTIYPDYGTPRANTLEFYYAFWKKYLEGDPLELMLATCLSHWNRYNQIRSTQAIYQGFLRDFPDSRYLRVLTPLLDELIRFWEIDIPEEAELKMIETSPESLEELSTLFEKKTTILLIWARSLNINGLAEKALMHSVLAQAQIDREEVSFFYLTIDDADPASVEALKETLSYFRLRGRHLVLDRRSPLTRAVRQELMKGPQYFPPLIMMYDQKGERKKLLPAFQIKSDRIVEEIQIIRSN